MRLSSGVQADCHSLFLCVTNSSATNGKKRARGGSSHDGIFIEHWSLHNCNCHITAVPIVAKCPAPCHAGNLPPIFTSTVSPSLAADAHGVIITPVKRSSDSSLSFLCKFEVIHSCAQLQHSWTDYQKDLVKWFQSQNDPDNDHFHFDVFVISVSRPMWHSLEHIY